MQNWLLLLSFSALLVGGFLLRKLWLGAFIGCIILIVGKLLFTEGEILTPLANGAIVSVELILLLFGAYLFYNTLASRDHFVGFVKSSAAFSSRLTMAILLCWFLGSFMEGIAGFGIPAMLIAPLMLAVGYRPLTSVVLPLAADTTAVTFGALGTPFKVGLDIYSNSPEIQFTVIMNVLPALTVPMGLAWLYSKTEQEKIAWKTEWKTLVWGGVCFIVPYGVVGQFSVEYPSVVAGLIGMIPFLWLSVPKKERPPTRVWLKTFYPYLLFVGMLIPAKYLLGSIGFSFGEGLKTFSLYQPGLVFGVSALVYLFTTSQQNKLLYLAKHAKGTFSRITMPIFTILFLVFFAQLLRQNLEMSAGQIFVEVSDLASLGFVTFAGVMGSFITGSATMGVLLFNSSVIALFPCGDPLYLRLALLLTGAAIGNAISFQNIVMVQSVVAQPVSISEVLSKNLKFVFIYLMVVFMEGAFISYLLT
ncbi:L-lactate permease [Algoriphagus sp. AGSA1]|uniref:L-lactate permease n=1 Tax=Algoriphagus sp. AGSA1 TaxID=2907213 RepID=UPI001F3B4009|nr:L-lactate permease [Algoriphagus sp. AGSA1]MCE7054656.1 L-lactate permease [Algoriphagus sp. AGSA1]